ncbi:MAG: hypothetical protein II881_02045 [Oscillospiraceae bacterium]|nr:hypothetical protein [Oscillospiraceae bacterium]
MAKFNLYVPSKGDYYDGFRGELNSFNAFLENYICSIYSFRGEEINLSGKIHYSNIWCDKKAKGIFARKPKQHEQIVQRLEQIPIFEAQLPDGVSLNTELETITPIETPHQRMMNVHIHVSKDYSSKIYNIRKKYESNKEIMYRIMDGLLNLGNNNSFTKGLFTIDVNTSYISMTSPGYIKTRDVLRFIDIGMQDLQPDLLDILAFADVFLECTRERYNNSVDFKSEIITISWGGPPTIAVDNRPEPKPW